MSSEKTDFFKRERDFCDVLPVDMQGRREDFELMGIVFGEVMANRMLIRCCLPKGWTKRATDSLVWSELLDEEQRVRARILYKPSVVDYLARLEAVE